MSTVTMIPVDVAQQARRVLERGPEAASAIGIIAMAMFVERQLADLAAPATPPSGKVLLRLKALLKSNETAIAELAAGLDDDELARLGRDTLIDLVEQLCGADDDAWLALAARLALLYGPEVLDGLLA